MVNKVGMVDDYTLLAERISVLETEWERTRQDITDIKSKLDELLHLKSKGLGALWLVGILLLFGSGLATFVYNVLNSVPKVH